MNNFLLILNTREKAQSLPPQISEVIEVKNYLVYRNTGMNQFEGNTCNRRQTKGKLRANGSFDELFSQ